VWWDGLDRGDVLRAGEFLSDLKSVLPPVHSGFRPDFTTNANADIAAVAFANKPGTDADPDAWWDMLLQSRLSLARELWAIC
jgi:hypothetical protein